MNLSQSSGDTEVNEPEVAYHPVGMQPEQIIQIEYKDSCYRWAILAVFVLCMMMNIGINVGFTAAAIPIKEAF